MRLFRLAAERFPSLGMYNLPVVVTDRLMESELMLGHALDDIGDIARDLREVQWCWTHTSPKDALWRFRFGFAHHWGHHLRSLQWYLHAYRQEHG